MASSKAKTVDDYLAELPEDRRAVVSALRDLVNRHLPPGYVEAMSWGMISWEIPLSRYPATYNKQPLAYVALAAQKQYYALYLMACYANSSQDVALRNAYADAGKALAVASIFLFARDNPASTRHDPAGGLTAGRPRHSLRRSPERPRFRDGRHSTFYT